MVAPSEKQIPFWMKDKSALEPKFLVVQLEPHQTTRIIIGDPRVTLNKDTSVTSSAREYVTRLLIDWQADYQQILAKKQGIGFIDPRTRAMGSMMEHAVDGSAVSLVEEGRLEIIHFADPLLRRRDAIPTHQVLGLEVRRSTVSASQS